MMDVIKSLIMRANYEAQSNWLKATQTLYNGISNYPEDSSLYNELGNLYFRKGSYEQASELYRQAHLLDKKNYDIIFKLAYCFLITKDYEKAISYFDLILGVIPEAAYNKCIALYQLHRGYQAIECLEELIAKHNTSDKPYLLLAKLYLENQRFLKVISLLNTTEQRFGAIEELFYLRGAACFNLKRWFQAYLDFQKAETLFNSIPTFNRMFALTCEKIGKTEKALELLLNTIENNPQFYAAYYDLIRIYTFHSKFLEALSIIERLSKKGVTLCDINQAEGAFFDSILGYSKKGSLDY